MKRTGMDRNNRRLAEKDRLSRGSFAELLGILLAGILTAGTLMGCGGPSEEKVEEAQRVYGELVEKHNEVIEAYANVQDDSFSKDLDQMAQQINAIGQQDIKNMEDEEIDAVIAQLKDNISTYDEILSSVDELKAQEEVVYGLPFTLKNDTGIDLKEIYLYQASDEDKGENLVQGMETLSGYGTFNMLNLYMTGEEMVWRLEAIDTEGDTIVSADIDFAGHEKDGVTALLKYDFDLGEGRVELEG